MEAVIKKILLIGAGAQGGPRASILAGEPGIVEIRLSDKNLALFQKVAHKIKSDKVQPFKLDASSKAQVEAARNLHLFWVSFWSRIFPEEH